MKRQDSCAKQIHDLTLALAGGTPKQFGKVEFTQLSSLPPPVEKYFRSVLKDQQALIAKANFEQTGELRKSPDSKSWMHFSAAQQVSPPAPGFVWNAKVSFAGLLHVRVLDSYIRGNASGAVWVLSAFPAGNAWNTPELNSGALHRYLAEAVWTPTALLPGQGVKWSAIDEHRALATLEDRGVQVSLEFRFNEKNEVVAVYSPGRWGSFDGGYKQVPWEGHFEDYREVQGMRVPFKGEVGWYSDNQLAIVWKGEMRKVMYEFSQ